LKSDRAKCARRTPNNRIYVVASRGSCGFAAASARHEDFL
jgi:hypothetical protein